MHGRICGGRKTGSAFGTAGAKPSRTASGRAVTTGTHQMIDASAVRGLTDADRVKQLRHHFGPFLALFPALWPPHSRRVIWSTMCACWLGADWCLRSDLVLAIRWYARFAPSGPFLGPVRLRSQWRRLWCVTIGGRVYPCTTSRTHS